MKFLLNDSSENFPFSFNIKTRWRDLDAFGHINNSMFATYIEDARISMFKRWNLTQEAGERSVIAASLKLDFLVQLNHPSSITVWQKVSRIGTTSFDIKAIIVNDDSDNIIVCESLVTCVCFNYKQQASVPVYQEIKDDYKKV